MKYLLSYATLILLIASGGAQTPAPSGAAAPAAHTYASELGFSYSIPADWDVTDLKQMKAPDGAGTTEAEKKGLGCVEMGFRAQHGTPPSVIVEVALPFACYGQELTSSDLPGFGEGASQALKGQFDTGEPAYGSYSLGTHQLWIERVKGSPKGTPGMQYTVEIACTPLKKAAACWIILAADDDALKAFESGMITLDDDKAVTLVPKTAFDKKP